MNILLILAYLFFVGSLFGWVLELFYRRFISKANPERRWINPGFCVGPYVPLYGSGLCALYLLAIAGEAHGLGASNTGRLVLFLLMAICMTGIEYLAGITSLSWLKVRLWDYRKEWGNIQGLICPKFSFFWALLSAAYYFLVHPRILEALSWLSENLAFSFFIGLFFGVFIIDVVYSAELISRMKKYADENQVIIRYEAVKTHIRIFQERTNARIAFLFPFRSELSIIDHLKDAQEALETRVKNIRKK